MTNAKPMSPRWEDAIFAAGGRVAIISGDGSIRYASSAAELEQLPTKKQPFTREEWARIHQIFREHDARKRAA